MLNEKVTYYRVTKSGSNDFSKYGDTIAYKNSTGANSIYNLTTGSSYPFSGEQGIVIKDIDSFPLFDTEEQNLNSWRVTGVLV